MTTKWIYISPIILLKEVISMTLEEFLSSILDEEDKNMAMLEPAFTFNLEKYEEDDNE
jgi:hypothetical protein